MFKIIYNVIGTIAILAGIYQGWVAFRTPKALVSLVYSTSDFEMPVELDPIFESLQKESLTEIEKAYSIVAKNTPIKYITYAGLYNNGDKAATDIRITFPNARLVSIRPDGLPVQTRKAQSIIMVDKLLPDTSVHFVIWSQRESNSEAREGIAGVHSEGRIELVPQSDLQGNWLLFSEMIRPFITFVCIAALLFLAYLLYGLLHTQSGKPTDT